MELNNVLVCMILVYAHSIHIGGLGTNFGRVMFCCKCYVLLLRFQGFADHCSLCSLDFVMSGFGSWLCKGLTATYTSIAFISPFDVQQLWSFGESCGDTVELKCLYLRVALDMV
ncbi:unnamed protein product [Lathyrus oleraceus]